MVVLPRWLTWDMVFYCTIFALAIFTRLVNLDARVMSHDESVQTKFAWEFARTGVFVYSPLHHGPLTMHLTAFSFRLFGDNDFTARLFPALMGIIMVMMPKLLFERWLGRVGAMIASVLILINPMLLYYSRMNREDTPLIFAVTIMIYAAFSYLDGVRPRRPVMLVLFSAAMTLALSASEFAFTHIMICAAFVLWCWVRQSGQRARAVVLIVGAIVGIVVLSIPPRPSDFRADVSKMASMGLVVPLVAIYLGALADFLQKMRKPKTPHFQKENRASFDVFILIFTLILPWLSGIPALLAGYQVYNKPGSTIAALPLAVFLVISILIGLVWRWRVWLLCAGVMFGLYTLLFLIPAGWSSGVVDTLAYWLPDGGGIRGSQPYYYYFVTQLPLYEFMSVFGLLITAIWVVIAQLRPAGKHKLPNVRLISFVAFCGFWALFVLVELTLIGAKMPWLVVNFSIPAIFVTAATLDKIISMKIETLAETPAQPIAV